MIRMADDIQDQPEFKIRLHERQTLAWDTLEDSEVMELLYGGAKGGGKSYFLCYWVYSECCRIIRDHNIGPQEHTIGVGFMGRLRSKDFKGTTLATWKRAIPPQYYRINQVKQTITIGGRVHVDYGGLDNQDRVQKFNSAEYGFIVLDQAEEIPEEKIAVLRATRRLQINGKPVRPKGLYTANPAQCWLKDEFILQAPGTAREKIRHSAVGNRRFVQALPEDNPWLPEEYVDILLDSFKHRPELIEAYLYGSWDAFEGADQVILAKWIYEAQQKRIHVRDKRKFIICDPARYGDDESVLYYMEETDILDAKYYPKISSDRLANILHIWALEKQAAMIGIDVGGLGGPIADFLVSMAGDDYDVLMIDSAEGRKSGVPVKYYNRRAEIWCTAAGMLADGDVMLTHTDIKLNGQLQQPTYKFRNGRILIEKKEDIKARLGCSPDRGDAYVMGLWMLQFVPRIGEIERSEKDAYSETPRASAMAY